MIEIVKQELIGSMEEGYSSGAHLPMQPWLYNEVRLTLLVDSEEIKTVQSPIPRTETHEFSREELARLIKEHDAEKTRAFAEACRMFEERFGYSAV